MNTNGGFFRRPLDEIFAAPSHVAVLRALLDTAQGLSGRETGRVAGVSHVAAARALGRLEDCGVVQRLGSGKTQLFRLNESNVLVTELIRPLLLAERRMFARMLDLIRGVVEDTGASVVMFGSTARDEELPDSDLDLLFVARTANERDAMHELAARVAEAIERQLGFPVSALVMTLTELRRRARKGDPFVNALLDEGIAVTGDDLREVRDGARRKTSGR